MRLDGKIYTIKNFTFDNKPQYQQQGMNAKTTMFRLKDRNTQVETDVSVFDYFQRTYNMRIEHWQLPLVNTERGGMFPMECCTVQAHQRYMFKMSPDQVSFLQANSQMYASANLELRLLP